LLHDRDPILPILWKRVERGRIMSDQKKKTEFPIDQNIIDRDFHDFPIKKGDMEGCSDIRLSRGLYYTTKELEKIQKGLEKQHCLVINCPYCASTDWVLCSSHNEEYGKWWDSHPYFVKIIMLKVHCGLKLYLWQKMKKEKK
jgi:hypothetical protein